MLQTINEFEKTKARKDYQDNNREWIEAMLSELRGGDFKLTFSEWRLIAESIRDNWKIKKGQIHDAGVFKHDDHIYTFRTKVGLCELCMKYELYPDDY